MQKGFSMVRNHKLLTLKDYYINTALRWKLSNMYPKASNRVHNGFNVYPKASNRVQVI